MEAYVCTFGSFFLMRSYFDKPRCVDLTSAVMIPICFSLPDLFLHLVVDLAAVRSDGVACDLIFLLLVCAIDIFWILFLRASVVYILFHIFGLFLFRGILVVSSFGSVGGLIWSAMGLGGPRTANSISLLTVRSRRVKRFRRL